MDWPVDNKSDRPIWKWPHTSMQTSMTKRLDQHSSHVHVGVYQYNFFSAEEFLRLRVCISSKGRAVLDGYGKLRCLEVTPHCAIDLFHVADFHLTPFSNLCGMIRGHSGEQPFQKIH